MMFKRGKRPTIPLAKSSMQPAARAMLKGGCPQIYIEVETDPFFAFDFAID